jgi:enterochelin esterase-like enzyme
MHKFVIKVNGNLETYTKYEDIPETFDHVIEFSPEVPQPPHTEEQHEEIDKWNFRLQALMEKERASSN